MRFHVHAHVEALQTSIAKHFKTLANIPVFSESRQAAQATQSCACCVARRKPAAAPMEAGSSCC